MSVIAVSLLIVGALAAFSSRISSGGASSSRTSADATIQARVRTNSSPQRGTSTGQPPIRQIGVSAEYGSSSSAFSTVVDAKYDYSHSYATAHVYATIDAKRVKDEQRQQPMAYDARSRSPGDVRLTIDPDLVTASLDATVYVEQCVDSSGKAQQTACPTGAQIHVSAHWFDAQEMESWRDISKARINVMRGRLAKASVNLDGVALDISSYAELVENNITEGQQ